MSDTLGDRMKETLDETADAATRERRRDIFNIHCAECWLSFATQKGLREHIEQKHPKQLPPQGPYR